MLSRVNGSGMNGHEKNDDSRKRKGNLPDESSNKKSRLNPLLRFPDDLEITPVPGPSSAARAADVPVAVEEVQITRRRHQYSESEGTDSDVVALDDDVEDSDVEDEGFDAMQRKPEVYNLSDDEDISSDARPEHAKRPLVLPDWPFVHHCVLVLDLRRPFYIVGTYELKCVKGCVEIMGAHLRSNAGYVPVYSSKAYGAVPISIVSSDGEDEVAVKMLKKKEFAPKPNDVVLVLRRLQNKITQHLLEFSPQVFGLSNAMVKAGEDTYPNLNYINCVGLYLHQKSAFRNCGVRLLDLDIASLCYNIFGGRKIVTEKVGTVIACGGKNTGKSTVLRCLLNAVVTSSTTDNSLEEAGSETVEKRRNPILFLDCDPGQPEFFVPGTVSLFEVTEPAIGPPFTHHVRPVASYYVGHVNVVSVPSEYLRCVEKLVAFKESKEEYANSPMFVNTMGWAKGLGVDLLVEVIRMTRPKSLLQISSESETHDLPEMSKDFVSAFESSIDFKPRSAVVNSEEKAAEPEEPALDFSLFYLRTCAEGEPNFRSVEGFRAPTNRDLTITTYFSQLQPGIARPLPLNHMVPYKVPWKSVAIHTAHFCLNPCDVLTVLNGNLVALCKIDQASVVKMKDSSHPKAVKRDALPECLGFGFVRAIDPDDKCFYIVTPLAASRVRAVNCISYGTVGMPLSILDEAPNYFRDYPIEVAAPNRGECPRPKLQRGVVARTFKKR